MFKRIIILFLILLPLLAKTQYVDQLFYRFRPLESEYQFAAFSSTRILTSHSVEQIGGKHFNLRYLQRFEKLRHGINDLFGFDQVYSHVGIDYGITDWLMLGVGRSSIQKNVDIFIKISLLRQKKRNGIPFFISYFTSAEAFTTKWAYPDIENEFSKRLSYVHQFLIARKFDKNFTLQITPTYIGKNIRPEDPENKTLLAIGLGGRYKVGDRVSINGEYFYAFRDDFLVGNNFHNALSLGVEIETGGNQIQLLLTNARNVNQAGYIWGDINNDWLNGEMHFGFNFSRVFSFSK